MIPTSRLCITLVLALAIIGTHCAQAVETEAASPDVVEDTFDYEQYQSPPIWINTKERRQELSLNEADDDFVPIQYRPGGARGGDGGNHRRRRRSFEASASSSSSVKHGFQKRAVIYNDDAQLAVDGDLKLENVITHRLTGDIDLPVIKIEKKSVEKRDVEDEAEEEDVDEGTGLFGVDALEDDENEGDEDEIEDEDDNENGIDSADEQDAGNDDGEFVWDLNNFQDDADEDDDENGEVDEEEERRLDNEAGLLDWIEEMKSEEYLDLAGRPSGQRSGDDDEDDESGVNTFDEDEPSPSEEEIFAANWRN
ncbi:hypothetical protein BGZ94_009532 [Podila epigama]|nr:hypothetical protein BGZ94_009532 [Podila epigama]